MDQQEIMNQLLPSFEKMNLSVLSVKNKGIEDFAYLLHHVDINDEGEEELHHCLIMDHIANIFELAHITVRDGKAYLDNKLVKDGNFHIIKGLDVSQEVAWSEEEAKEHKIRPKKMTNGMTAKDKVKEW